MVARGAAPTKLCMVLSGKVWTCMGRAVWCGCCVELGEVAVWWDVVWCGMGFNTKGDLSMAIEVKGVGWDGTAGRGTFCRLLHGSSARSCT